MRLQRNFHKRRGNAMIEFALLWAFLFPVLSGVGQFGSAYYQYDNLCSSVRNAARFASLQTFSSVSTTVPTDLRDAVRNMVRYGDPTPNANSPLIADVPVGNIDVTMTFDNGVPAMIDVKVTQYAIETIFKNITINNKPQSQFPFVGRWDPVP
jgi:Flp pilus assembly protein TadG